jgi:small neutral amino acid transporter SnatA (MarC family)
MNPLGLILVAGGLLSICGAAFDWDFFINSRKARFFVSTFGRTGARIFYAILGLVIMVLGVLISMGILKDAT